MRGREVRWEGGVGVGRRLGEGRGIANQVKPGVVLRGGGWGRENKSVAVSGGCGSTAKGN